MTVEQVKQLFTEMVKGTPEQTKLNTYLKILSKEQFKEDLEKASENLSDADLVYMFKALYAVSRTTTACKAMKKAGKDERLIRVISELTRIGVKL